MDMTKILVVDDDPGILESTQLLLEFEGYEVDTASCGDSLYKLDNNLPDLILLDIWLSGENGGDIAKVLKSKSLTKNIPIILFSANRDIEIIQQTCGADDCIAKPFQFEDLLTKLRKHLKIN